jgi:plasmid stabilization system protein ParE
VKVRLNEDAEADVDVIDTWWRENRPEAPDLFRDELAAVLDLLASSPHAGETYKRLAGHAVRRTLLERTRRYVYHFVADDETVLVVAVWGTERGQGPRLRLR